MIGSSAGCRGALFSCPAVVVSGRVIGAAFGINCVAARTAAIQGRMRAIARGETQARRRQRGGRHEADLIMLMHSGLSRLIIASGIANAEREGGRERSNGCPASDYLC